MSEKDYLIGKIRNTISEVSANDSYYVSGFLNPFEQNLWQQNHKKVNLDFWGGYRGAERKIVFVTSFSFQYNSVILKKELSAIEAKLNNFVQVTHRQVLGTLMHSGLSRDVIGDIMINPENIQLIVKQSIANFFLDNPLNINHNVLNFKKIGFDQIIEPIKNFSTLIDTVPSLRIDVCLAKMLKISRKISQSLILDGKVLVNFQEVSKIHYLLTENEIITVRGFGRIKFNRVIGRSKKDKIVIEYQKV